jgi:AraC-like DNA-binding protein
LVARLSNGVEDGAKPAFKLGKSSGAANMIYKSPTIRCMGRLFLPREFQDVWSVGPSTDWRAECLQRFLDSQDGKIGLNLDTVVRSLNLEISAIHAARLFKRETGIGVRQYCRRRRLVMAAFMLGASDQSIKQIAAELGYRDVRDFARAFKASFCKSPTEFRTMHRHLRIWRSNARVLEARAV